jgi:transposase-like protein
MLMKYRKSPDKECPNCGCQEFVMFPGRVNSTGKIDINCTCKDCNNTFLYENLKDSKITARKRKMKNFPE